MAFLKNTTQYAAQLQQRAAEKHGTLKVAKFTYTHSGTSEPGEINLFKLPAGRVVVLPELSHLNTTSFGVGAQVSLGVRAHRRESGELVEEDADALLAASLGPFVGGLGAPPTGEIPLESQSGIVVYATIAGGNLISGHRINGYIVYSQ
jgi:hypothetical protein